MAAAKALSVGSARNTATKHSKVVPSPLKRQRVSTDVDAAEAPPAPASPPTPDMDSSAGKEAGEQRSDAGEQLSGFVDENAHDNGVFFSGVKLLATRKNKCVLPKAEESTHKKF